MIVEPLVADGAVYPCAFAFTYPGEPTWECPGPASVALSAESYQQALTSLPASVTIAHRSLCQGHVTLLEDHFGL